MRHVAKDQLPCLALDTRFLDRCCQWQSRSMSESLHVLVICLQARTPDPALSCPAFPWIAFFFFAAPPSAPLLLSVSVSQAQEPPHGAAARTPPRATVQYIHYLYLLPVEPPQTDEAQVAVLPGTRPGRLQAPSCSVASNEMRASSHSRYDMSAPTLRCANPAIPPPTSTSRHRLACLPINGRIAMAAARISPSATNTTNKTQGPGLLCLCRRPPVAFLAPSTCHHNFVPGELACR
ncbi:hypothetical protein V8C40DRAFT_221569 [Trichoderma camerunense]